MRLPKFKYLEPESLEEASSLLLDHPEARVFAGGTDLLVNMKHRVEVPTATGAARPPAGSFTQEGISGSSLPKAPEVIRRR